MDIPPPPGLYPQPLHTHTSSSNISTGPPGLTPNPTHTTQTHTPTNPTHTTPNPTHTHTPTNPTHTTHTLLPGDHLPNTFSLDKHLADFTFLSNNQRYTQIGGALIESPSYRWRYTIQAPHCMYIPKEGDYVVGIITQKSVDNYSVDIGSSLEAEMPTVDAFEGATRQHKPNLIKGSCVYGVVVEANTQIVPKIVCKSLDSPKTWSTFETYFGELKEGLVFSIPLHVAHSLLGDRCFILERIGKSLSYEIAVGMNGRVWIKAEKAINAVIVMNIIQHINGLTLPQMEALCRKLLNE